MYMNGVIEIDARSYSLIIYIRATQLMRSYHSTLSFIMNVVSSRYYA